MIFESLGFLAQLQQFSHDFASNGIICSFMEIEKTILRERKVFFKKNFREDGFCFLKLPVSYFIS